MEKWYQRKHCRLDIFVLGTGRTDSFAEDVGSGAAIAAFFTTSSIAQKKENKILEVRNVKVFLKEKECESSTGRALSLSLSLSLSLCLEITYLFWLHQKTLSKGFL